MVCFKITSKRLSSDNEKRHRKFDECVRFVAVTAEKIRVSCSEFGRC